MLFTDDQTWPPSRNGVAGVRPSPWCGAKLLRQLSFVLEQLLKKARSLEFPLPSRVVDALSGTSPAVPTQ